MNTRTRVLSIVTLVLIVLSTNHVFAENPELSKHLINLSEGVGKTSMAEHVPEMVVSGNTIHTVWIQYVTGSEGYLYYRRSTDLGDTWEDAKLIKTIKDASKAITYDQRRLAVDGENVYIAITDYDYPENGTGKVFFFQSANGGSSFSTERLIASTDGGYKAIYNSFIKAVNGKIAIVYQGAGSRKGAWALFSSNNGTTFTDTKIHDESTYVSDLYFDGSQMIVMHGFTYYMYGLNTGKIWVSVSENGTAFITNQISHKYTTDTGQYERCLSRQTNHYAPKIAKSGSNIHVIFEGNNDAPVWTVFYARSTNNGNTFEQAIDINQGATSSIEGSRETIAAKNGQVYIVYQNTGYKLFFAHSANSGESFSTATEILPTGISHIEKTNLPSLVIDQHDETGKTLYVTGNWFYSTRSTNGGVSFSNFTSLAPTINSNIINLSHGYMISDMVFDNQGGMHWISTAIFRSGKDKDILYRNVKQQPAPGEINKSFYIEALKNSYKSELVVVPNSTSLKFDSAMTAEVWVKFRPGTEARSSILAKVNGYDGYDNDPTGYHLGFRQDKGLIKLNAGIKTDKGGFVNWADINMNDTLWHHIAMTYDAGAGQNNFKLYINGLLHKEQTVTGAIFDDEGMLMLGTRFMGTTWYYDAKYELDDLRLWNRSLSQEELLKNQTTLVQGNENGLKLFLNFDDTFKDITGNGNDGIPVYDGRLEISDMNKPTAGFDLFQVSNEISLNNKSANAIKFEWGFGNGHSSTLGNPKYSYPNPGEYQVSLLAKNSNSVTASVKQVSILGLERVEPAKSGNNGFVTVTAYGGGIIADGSTFVLRKAGATDIVGKELHSPAPGQLSAQFLMNNAATGKWDIVVTRNNTSLILKEAFQINQATLPEPWVSLSGRGMVLLNMWQTYTINYGNKGNVDALGVPLNIVVSDIPGMGFEMIDFKVEPNAYMKQNFAGILAEMDSLFVLVKDYFGPGHNARFYPLIIPVVEANSTHSIRIRMKAPADFHVECWTSEPLFQTDDSGLKSADMLLDDWPDEKTKLNACIALSAAHAMSSSAMDMIGMVLPVGCAYDVATFIWNPWDAAKPTHNQSAIFNSTLYGLSSALLSCAGDLTPFKAVKIAYKLASIINNMYAGYKAHQDCLHAFDPKYKNKKNVSAVSSFDPNEMVGPAGFGPQNYIADYTSIPYTILFENKSEATAPAHIVTIIDSLDLSVFNITEFGFGPFGWGDTLIVPPANNLKQFSMDIGLRPKMELITRVSALLDTISGVIVWEFHSLNPETMDIEEDPFIGFLPPNKMPPQGDGFVSFTVGLNNELVTNSEISNKAIIIFDANAPIVTNEFLNTLDFDPPTSKVLSLETNNFKNFDVSWTGSDLGAGIQHYNIYVLENDTLLYNWLQNTTDDSAEFQGSVGSTYKFFSLAIDQVGHLENEKDQFEAQTTIIVGIDDKKLSKANISVYPNPAYEILNIQVKNENVGVAVIEITGINGMLYHSKIYRHVELQQGITVGLKTFKPGPYLLRVVSEGKSETIKFMIKQ